MAHPFRADDRLVKTLVLSAVAPEVPALKDLTAARLAALNHGSISTPAFQGREATLVLSKVRRWSADVPEIHIVGDTRNPVIRVRVSEVDYESVVEKAKGEDNEGRTRAMRDVILGADPASATLTRRAADRLAQTREEQSAAVHPGGTVITQAWDGDLRWWTWAGFRANATLAATLSDLTDPMQRFQDQYVRLRADLTREQWQAGTADAAERLCLPDINERALAGLKFSAALPPRLATATLATRLADVEAAITILKIPSRFVVNDHLGRGDPALRPPPPLTG